VLVTGGGGFIGANLVEALSDKNHVVIFDDFSTGKKKNLEGLDVNTIEDSITNFNAVKKAVKNIDYVFHLAALPSVPRSIKDPVKTNEVNIGGTLNVLMASKEEGVKKVVFASSSSVYGDTPTLPKVETMLPNPQSPYAVSKLTGEYYCKVLNEVYTLPTTSLRFFNVYGPKQDPESEYAAVIPRFIHKLKENRPPVIYGDGGQTRDFTFVKDAVRAAILAAESVKANGEVFNVGGGKRITINELARKIAKLMDRKFHSEHSEPRKGDVRHSLADIGKGARLMSYSPKYSLDYGLADTITYFRKAI
jgi:UDP-glucose 4-epimerase